MTERLPRNRVVTAGTAPAAEPAPKSWQEMREWCARLLQARTGQDVAAWNERIAAGAPDNRADALALRAWLSAQGVTGYAQALLAWETFGYPEYLVADAEDLIARQYADRPHLRAVFDAVLAALPALPARSLSRRAARSSPWPRRAGRSRC